MTVTLNDILKLHTMGSSEILAGKNGLNRPVTSAGILDYEYSPAWDSSPDYAPANSEALFEKNSIVITSFLFAGKHPDLIEASIRNLINLGVSTLAFKPVIYDDLPADVLKIADLHDFPILKLGMHTYFENIIFDIMETVKSEDYFAEGEQVINKMITESLSPSQVSHLVEMLNPELKGTVAAFYFKMPASRSRDSINQQLRNFRPSALMKRKTVLCRFQSGAMVITAGENGMEGMEGTLRDILALCPLDQEARHIGISNLHPCSQTLHLCVKEAYYSAIAAEVEEEKSMYFSQLGIYQYLVPNRQEESVICYMENYLAPLQKSDLYLLETAIQFIKAKGNMDLVANQLCCHKNTVRYRIKNIHALLADGMPYEVFYEQLSSAIKIYLLNKLD